MKTVEQIKPTYAAVYAAALYPDLCKLFQKHGYALAVHGSLARDFETTVNKARRCLNGYAFAEVNHLNGKVTRNLHDAAGLRDAAGSTEAGRIPNDNVAGSSRNAGFHNGAHNSRMRADCRLGRSGF